MPYQLRALSSSVSRCAPERSTTTVSGGGSNAAAASLSRQRKRTSAPLSAASSFGTNAGSEPLRRGSSASAPSPASESEPSATSSRPGWARTRSSVSCPEYPPLPRMAALFMMRTIQRGANYAAGSSGPSPDGRAAAPDASPCADRDRGARPQPAEQRHELCVG